jgi:hypothetical protein
MARKVLVERTKGGPHPNFPVGTVKQGWELSPPKEGDPYVIFTESGSVFRTSRVTKLSNGTFETRNSVYRLIVLEERAESPPGVTREVSVDFMENLFP